VTWISLHLTRGSEMLLAATRRPARGSRRDGLVPHLCGELNDRGPVALRHPVREPAARATLAAMATAIPVQLERALRKLEALEPLTRAERELLHRRGDEVPLVDELDDPEEVRRFLGLEPSAALPAEVVAQMKWREHHRDSDDPVRRALARAPLAEEPLSPEREAERAAQDAAPRVGPVPHAEIERMLEERLRALGSAPR
jgi:hypothetical protein